MTGMVLSLQEGRQPWQTTTPEKSRRLATTSGNNCNAGTPEDIPGTGLPRIILNSAEGHSDQAVAQMLSTTRATVGKWRRRFLRNGCDGLLDEPRSGTPRSIGDDEVEQVVVRTLESMPRGGTQWSTRSMARACGLSSATVSRIWRAFALKPHRSETFKPAVYRESARHRGALPPSARAGRGVVRG